MVTILLEAGAGLEQPGRDGFHPMPTRSFSEARNRGALIQRERVDAKESWAARRSSVLAATGGSDIEIARILLVAGADPGIVSAKVDDSYAVLHYAAETEEPQTG